MKRAPLFTEIGLILVIGGATLTLSWALFSHYRQLSKRSEIPQNLKLIYEGAVTFSDRAALKRKMGRKTPWFPLSTTLTPSFRCCSGKNSVPCVPGGRGVTAYSMREWGNDTWRALHFSLKDPHLFRYQFVTATINGNPGFYAQARGDLNCDSKESLFRRTGEITGDHVTPGLEILEIETD